MANSDNDIHRKIKVKGQKLSTTTSFKFLGAVVSDDVSKPKVLLRIAQTNTVLTKLVLVWCANSMTIGSKVKIMRSLVFSVFLYACELWILTAELGKSVKIFEMIRYRKLSKIS